MHTLLNLRGAIPTFIHISEDKLHEVNVLDFARLYQMHQARALQAPLAGRVVLQVD